MIRILTNLIFLCVFACSAIGQEAHLTNRLTEALKTNSEEHIFIYIYLEDRLDVLALDKKITSEKRNLKERSSIVINSLKDHAHSTQANLLQLLKSHPGVIKESIQEYWIANVIFAKLKPALIEILRTHPDVSLLDLNGKLSLVEATIECVEAPLTFPGQSEIGLRMIKADKLWAMGYTGRGRLALGADTGIQPDHPALDGQYMGLYFDHERSWFSWNNTFPEPSDCDGHGTHTVGTVLGIDRVTDDTIGVAPNANFLGARILCGGLQGNGGTIDNVASFQWSLDPDNNPDTVDDIPDVINNSWHDPSLGDEPCDNVYVEVMKAMEAVGIAVVFSAGNEGPEPGTITHPHNVNYDLVNTFTVGALNGNNINLNIADFSSRGPSMCGGDSSILIKPEVSAPGASVRSAHLDGSYQYLSGTSMAAPHVAGAILLLKEAFPYLTGRDLKFALYYSCTDLGDVGEDNTFGMGIINVEAAFNYLVNEGNVPVDPEMEKDVVLFNMQTRAINCDNQVPASVSIENLGTDEVTTMTIEVSVPELDLTETMLWTGSLNLNDRVDVELMPFDLPSGNHQMEVTIIDVNGAQDDFFFNNRLMRIVNSTSLVSIKTEALNEELTLCQGSRALLRAEYENVKNGEVIYVWYNRAERGNLLDTGQVFLTPELKDTTTYYAGVFVNYSLGMEDNDLGELADNTSVVGGLLFDVHLPLMIKSVKVYTEEKGLGSIVLLDSNGDNLQGSVFVASGPGEHTVDLNFEIPEGRNYRLDATGILEFSFNTSGAEFPYRIDELITITGNSIPGLPSDGYLFFYDWVVQHNEICGRKAITVNVSEMDSIPNADFLLSDTVVMIDNNPTIDFTDNSAGAVDWEWDFGDGNTSTMQNPIHTYDMEGIFQVSLIVTNSLGCQDAIIYVVEVLEGTSAIDNSEFESFKIYPNPTRDFISIEKASNTPNLVHIEIRDFSGKLITEELFSGQKQNIKVDYLETGIYLLIIKEQDKIESHKIIKF